MRFALMLMNKGTYGYTRVLGRKTVEYMLSNQIGPEVKNLIGNADPTRADYGFGLGLAVRTTPGIVRLMGSVEIFNWPGATGTNWWADPREELAVVWMAYTPGSLRWKYRELINALVYQATIHSGSLFHIIQRVAIVAGLSVVAGRAMSEAMSFFAP